MGGRYAALEPRDRLHIRRPGGDRHLRRARRRANCRRILHGQDHFDPDGDAAGRQLRPLRPCHRRASLPLHSRQPDHHHGTHAGRRRGRRRQPSLRSGTTGRHQDPALALHPTCREAGAEGRALRIDQIQWLGTFDAIAHTMAIWHSAQVTTIDVLKTKPLVIGSFAKGHLTYQWPAMMKHVLGTSYQVITGYRSGSDLNLAMERGEIDGWAASWENLV